MTHPATSGSVAADVAEAALVVPVGRAETHFLNRLVDDQTLRLVVHHAQTVSADVQKATNGTTTRVLKERRGDRVKKRRLSMESFVFHLLSIL